MSINIKSNKSKIIKFDLQIEGSDIPPDIRFIIETDRASYMFKGEISDGTATIKLPELRTIIESLEAGEYRAKVEALIEGSFYEPWIGVVDIENPIDVKMVSEMEETTSKSDKKIQLTLAEDTKPKPNKIVKKTATKKTAKKTNKKIVEAKTQTTVKKAKELLTEML